MDSSKRTIVCAIIAGLASMPLTGVEAAPRYAQNGQYCQDYDFDYRFDGSGWTANTLTWVEGGFRSWLAVKQPSGASRVNMSKTTSTTADVWRVRIVESIEGGFSGITRCAEHVIEIDDAYASNEMSLRQIARHEAGHAIGLRHTGRYDDRDNASDGVDQLPTMGTCIPYGTAIVTEDDYANLSREPKGSTAANNIVSSNIGWELGTTGHFVTGDPNYSTQTSHVYQGTRGARLSGSSLVSYTLSQTINYVARREDQGDDLVDLVETVQIRPMSSNLILGTSIGTNSSSVTLQVETLNVNYQENDNCDRKNFISGQNQNERYIASFDDWRVRSSVTCFLPAQGSWQRCLSGVVQEHSNYSTHSGIDYRIKLIPRLRTTDGAYGYVAVDNLGMLGEMP
jgi:hypothetical protein